MGSITCFLIGGIPSGLIIGRILGGSNLRTYGSGNIGATNALRAYGVYPALMTLTFDIIKGIIPLILIKIWNPNALLMACCGMSAILGHDFSPYLKFNGGKGVATSLGVFLVLSPKAILISFLFWMLLLAIFKIVSIASIGAGILLPLVIYPFGYPVEIFFAGILACLLIMLRHKDNIRRLIRGEEKRLGRDKSKA
ncbi:glycerol-3-phosphate 1-O-acyltransferase PlsY [bacterium]|nr:glycerol-3-phosphate 1-O-acyltransferase PlsY [bacterium]